MTPGEWRSEPEHDVAVGRHHPRPAVSSATYAALCHRFGLTHGRAGVLRLAAGIIPEFHHPFPDGTTVLAGL